jgi:transketolase
MRNAFIEELVLAAKNGKEVALIVGDLGYRVIEPFADLFPERFFNAGIAEQNMMGLAAGMASEGVHVFAYSIANFPTFRCAEQIRNDIDYHNLPVTVVSVGGGLAYGALGYSHHAIQDYAMMRILPNMLIAAPGDPMEVRGCMRYLINSPQPSYLRLGKAGEKSVHQEIPAITPGEWLEINYNKNIVVQSENLFLTTGTTLINTHEIVGNRKEVAHFSIPMWGMKFKNNQYKKLIQWNNITTIEDHLVDGGFGSWILEILASNGGASVGLNLKGLNSKVCGMVGSQDELLLASGIFSNLLSET